MLHWVPRGSRGAYGYFDFADDAEQRTAALRPLLARFGAVARYDNGRTRIECPWDATVKVAAIVLDAGATYGKLTSLLGDKRYW